MLPEVKPTTPAGIWADQVNKSIRSSGTGASTDNLTNHTHNSLTIRPKTLSKVNGITMGIPTAYDRDEAYGIGDMVYITMMEQPVGSNYEFISGIWLCVQNVPSNKFVDDVNVPNTYKRNNTINYYPRWPMPYVTDRYWMLFSIFPNEMTVCENRINKTYWVSATQRSGSI